MSLLEVRGLTLTYPGPTGDVIALDDVSFCVEPGERVAIIGRSGSGKTSLLRAVSGLIKPSGGDVFVDGMSVQQAQTKPRVYHQKVGLVFQDYGLVRQLSALQNTLCGALHRYDASRGIARFGAEDRAKAEALLTTFGLGERLHLPSAKLSGGEQQRVAISRLLTQSPKLMLLDEPIASLDVHWAKFALEQLSAQEDATALVILHDLSMVRTWATRALLIQDGELLFDGSPEEACARLEQTPSSATPSSPDAPPVMASSAVNTQPGSEHTLHNKRAFYAVLVLGIIALYVWAASGVNLGRSKLFGSAKNAVSFVGRLLPPDFSVSATIFDALLETIQMAIWGTTIAAVLALPLSILAATNITPWFLRVPTRLFLNLMRTVPSLIWGLFFVAIVGLGPLPGILALSFYATGYLGKFYYEGIESISPGPLVALRTVGASRLQRFRYGVFPQVLPLFASYTIYMFEYNVRAASILGIVGAGGVGFYLHAYINNFVYTKASTALLMLLILVTVIDIVSSRVRQRLTL